MALNITSTSAALSYQKEINESNAVSSQPKPRPDLKIVWVNVSAYVALHIGSLYGLYLIFTSAKLLTTLFAYTLYFCSGLGITAGVHRLWSHKAYKANFPLQCLLLLFNTLSFQNSVYEWARDHRVHHKYSETDADPHNAARGFFFAHMGWLLCRKHPDVIEKGKHIDMSDLLEDPLVAFQKKYYFYIMPLIAFILPTVIPVYFWGETWTNAFFIPTVLRYTFTLHMTWLVNSAAHFFGGKPYDRSIYPAENVAVTIAALGEGWHNYHHTFPWDYRAAELGNYRINITTAFIDFFARIGWAYDLKRVSDEVIAHRVKKNGDGTHELWSSGDKDQPAEERDAAIIENHAKDQ